MRYYGASSFSINAIWVIVGVFVILLDIVVSTIADTIATEKGHKGITFGIICFLTGPIGCILVAALPDKPRIEREQKIADTLDTLLRVMNNQPQSDTAKENSVADNQWVCKHCGAMNDNDTTFCLGCGENRE